jgi:hypothetical protein
MNMEVYVTTSMYIPCSVSTNFKVHAMWFNIFIQNKLNFYKINSFFSSIEWLIDTGSVQHQEAQVMYLKTLISF